MRNKIKRFIATENLAKEGSRIIVGFSGGADSVVLLHMLSYLGYDCIAAHCNFHLRGEESLRDELFATSFAASLGVPFFKIDFETETYACNHKISIEMAARELRYEWFEELRRKIGAASIAVAHHKDDNVETLLLNLIRGTGIRGLAGIKPKTNYLIRPLLCLSKKEILLYAANECLEFVTDSSNLKEEFVRNKIRLQVIPLLQTINPSVQDAISRTILNMDQTLKVYNSVMENAKKEVWDRKGNSINIQQLKSFEFYEALLYEILTEFGFGNSVINEILLGLDGQAGKIFYAAHYRLIKDRENLYIMKLQIASKDYFIIEENTSQLRDPLNLKMIHFILEQDFTIDKNKQIAYFDKDKLKFPLVLRRWKTGDRFVPYGMKGTKKLSDYFNDHKYSKIDKENTWLLCSDENIIWIVGERIDDRYKLTNITKNVVTFVLEDLK